MRRILAGVAALALGLTVWAALPARALSSLTASLCVDGPEFVFEVTVEDVESQELIVELLNANSGHIEWITATITVNQASGDASFDIGPTIMASSGLATDSWALPFTNSGLVLSPGTVGWDVTFIGTVLHGTEPYSAGDTLPNVFARDALEPPSDMRIFDVPIADCSAGSTTTTSTSSTTSTTVTTSTTTSTTVASTTTSSIGGSTLPFTGVGSEEFVGVGLMLVSGGILLIIGGLSRREET